MNDARARIAEFVAVPMRVITFGAVATTVGAFVLTGQASADTTQTKTFTDNASFTVPKGVASITVELIAAGAGGGAGAGASEGATAGGGGGGGGGGARASCVLSVEEGQVLTLTVGAPGEYGTSGMDAGEDGGDATLTIASKTVAIAAGGKGGKTGMVGQASETGFGTGGAGGAGGSADASSCTGTDSEITAGGRGENGGDGGEHSDHVARGGSWGDGGAAASPVPSSCPAETGSGGRGSDGGTAANKSKIDQAMTGKGGCIVFAY